MLSVTQAAAVEHILSHQGSPWKGGGTGAGHARMLEGPFAQDHTGLYASIHSSA